MGIDDTELRKELRVAYKTIEVGFRLAVIAMKKQQRKSGLRGGKSEGDCQICLGRRPGASEVYEVQGPAGISRFDVAIAKQIVSDGRISHVVPRRLLEAVPVQHQFEEVHLGHVNPAIPGVLGKYRGGIVLIDGIHKAIRCLREGQQFRAYFLDEQECLSCVVSQDLWETSAGAVAARLRELLQDNPDRNVEIRLDCSPYFVSQIRKMLTAGENERINIVLASEK